jgi:hypothetical protein
MDSPETLLIRARRSLQVAEKLFLHTYPVVDDPKLLLSVTGELRTALESGMDAVLAGKGISKEDFSSRLGDFRRFADEISIEADDISLIDTLHTIMQQHKESPVEFPRNDCFVICDENYHMLTISSGDVKQYLFKAGVFIDKVERYFRKR